MARMLDLKRVVMVMERAVLILDLDGTLLGANGEISSADNDALLKFKERYDLILASGRHFRDVDRLLPKINVQPRYVICSDGVAIHKADGSALENWDEMRLLDSKDVETILGMSKKGEVLLIAEDKTFVYRESLVNRFKRFFSGLKLPIYHKTKCNFFEKIRIQRKDVSDAEFKKIADGFSTHLVLGRFIDIKKKGVSKLSAIQAICRLHQLSEEKILYFGDDMNDVECFDHFKHCIAMGNACEGIKEKAEYITKPNSDNGVAFALEQYFGN